MTKIIDFFNSKQVEYPIKPEIKSILTNFLFYSVNYNNLKNNSKKV